MLITQMSLKYQDSSSVHNTILDNKEPWTTMKLYSQNCWKLPIETKYLKVKGE